MAISRWPLEERPREKLLAKGAAVLSDAELLAIFLRTGLPGLTAIDLARNLLTQFGGLGPLLSADRQAFCSAKGLGPAKYCQIQATLELTTRYLQEQLCGNPVFTRPGHVRDYLAVQMRDYQREVFVVLLLDTRHQLLEFRELFQGTIDAANVHPREVVRSCSCRKMRRRLSWPTTTRPEMRSPVSRISPLPASSRRLSS